MANAQNKSVKQTCGERARFVFLSTKDDGLFRAAENTGSAEVSRHFSKGRSVVIGENGRVIRLYPDGRREEIKK